MTDLSPAASRFIHLARWVAALLVVIHHVATAFVSVPDIMTAPHGPLAYLVWFVSPYAFAHEAVVAFFVLSGFLVGGSVAGRVGLREPWLRDYALDRIVRIYIVFIPALALTLLCDRLGMALFPDQRIYGPPLFKETFSLSLLVPNLLSLQGLWFEPFGSNLPLWSLGMEVWYYLLFPLMLLPWLAAYPRHAVRVGGVAFALIFLMSLPSGSYVPFGFAIWGLGALARKLPRPLVPSKWASLALFLIVSVVLRLVVREPAIETSPTKYFVDGVDALLFANLLLSLRFDDGEGFAWARARVHERLAEFSYTLYATHVPVVFFVLGVVGAVAGPDWRRQNATPQHYALTGTVIVGVVLLAWTISRATEARTADLRRFVRRRFARERVA